MTNISSIEKFYDWKSRELMDPDLSAELTNLSLEANANEINDRFCKELEFGTGGLRGIIGAGTNRMNVYTVAKATQGYSNYLNKKYESSSVAIAYDSRIKSEDFAHVAAEVFAANGIRVYIFSELMPTPVLSFAVRYLQCSGGVVITASHNSSKYNGYKVYGEDGCQITNKVAEDIFSKMNSVDMFNDVKYIDFTENFRSGMISYINEEVVNAYLSMVSMQSLCGDEYYDKDISIVYTPLNGSGLKCVTKVLEDNGYTNISVVQEQCRPDGNFPTCPYPNPETKEALALGVRDATRRGSDILLATDPDCDRVGIAVRSGNDYVYLSGNEVGILLFDYICKRKLKLHQMPKQPVLIKTIVTTDMARLIANDYGVDVIEVLTGFKYIGEQIGLLERDGEKDRFILGFEESYGYLTGDYVRDKDGVDGSFMICEMASYYKAQGLSLSDALDSLYEKYGYYLNTLHSYVFEDTDGLENMKHVMDHFRNDSPNIWIGRKILVHNDYLSSISKFADGTEGKIDLPKSNVLKYQLEENCSFVVRPSGTEPKLKIYISVSAKDRTSAEELEKTFVSELEDFAKL